ncbi:squalene/phytoene synthase family protein [Primorskyibacter sp. S87]|uniref:squalene/phytoene synthase family protein n=1 Tax=Primorskyibacter sp. S87 TaxID=3415126 RepID=UPI003C7B2671
MTFDADLTACAALVEKADPDRFSATMAAPVAARRVLFPIYAMNVEVSRAPWVTQEAMIAEMRLQWWRDALAEIAAAGPVRRHEVVTPLARALTPALAAQLDAYVAVRRWDIYRDPFEDAAHLDSYIDQSAATLMWVSTQALGQADEATVRNLGYAAGVAGFLRAVPELEMRGRVPLFDGTPEGVRALATSAMDKLKTARANRRLISAQARPALLTAWQASSVLRQVIDDPRRVADGRLGQSRFHTHAGLVWQSLTGRW